MEAFSDGVIAIIITVMVLELGVPHQPTLAALRPLLPTIACYAVSFVFVGIYWNNHHHLFQAVEVIDGRVLWANLHLLFWLSLIPFVTNWMGEGRFAPWPVALYGGVLLCAGVAYFVLTRALLAIHAEDSAIAAALGADFKGKIYAAVDRVRALRVRGGDLAGSGPADRAGAEALSEPPAGRRGRAGAGQLARARSHISSRTRVIGSAPPDSSPAWKSCRLKRSPKRRLASSRTDISSSLPTRKLSGWAGAST